MILKCCCKITHHPQQWIFLEFYYFYNHSYRHIIYVIHMSISYKMVLSLDQHHACIRSTSYRSNRLMVGTWPDRNYQQPRPTVYITYFLTYIPFPLTESNATALPDWFPATCVVIFQTLYTNRLTTRNYQNDNNQRRKITRKATDIDCYCLFAHKVPILYFW